MNVKLICLLCVIVVINCLFLANGEKGGIKSPSRRRSSDDDDETENINEIVAIALNSQFEDKRLMLPVSPTHYNIAMTWRKLKRYFSKKVLKLVSPGILRDARVGKLLNTLIYENHILRQMDNVIPTRSIPEKKPNKLPEGDDVDEDNSAKKLPAKNLLRPPMRRNLS